jgi:hypothetical protein
MNSLRSFDIASSLCGGLFGSLIAAAAPGGPVEYDKIQ